MVFPRRFQIGNVLLQRSDLSFLLIGVLFQRNFCARNLQGEQFSLILAGCRRVLLAEGSYAVFLFFQSGGKILLRAHEREL